MWNLVMSGVDILWNAMSVMIPAKGADICQRRYSIIRRDICHKHHKQRLCRIIRTRVKFHFVNVLFEQFMYVSF